MAITYVGGQVGGRAGSTSTSNVTFALTGGSDSTPQAGDLVIIGCTVASQARTPACAISGYTAQTQINANGTTYDTSLNMSWKFMGGTPDTTFTLPSTGNIADAQRWTVQVWRGVDPTTPLDVTPVSASGTATGRPNPGSITPSTSGAYVGIIGAGAAATGAAYTAPANYTTNFLTGTTADTNDAMIGSGYRSWTSGAEDPAQYTGGTTNAVDSWAAFTYALRPQGAVTHATTGALTGSGAVVTGAALRTPAGQPTLISTTAITLGTSATPGAQSITVPADAQLVVVQATTYAPGGLTLSLVSSFAGTFTVENAGAGSDQCHIAYALVSSTGSQTITPTWSGAVTDGPLFLVSFVKGINTSDFLRDAVAFNANSQGTTASTSIATGSNDLLLVMDRQAATTTPPGTMSGYVSVTTQGNNNIGGRVETCSYPGASSTTVTTDGTEFPGLSMISIKPAGGPVTHATTGALTGQGSTVAGAAAHIAVHGSTGALVGQGSAVAGSGTRFRAHDSSGSVVGQGSTIAGSASRSSGAVTHDTSGALVGQGSAITGSATRLRAHDATGALVGPGASVAGAAARWRAFSSSGVLVGSGASIAGSAARTRQHDTAGALVGQGPVVTGSAQHNIPHGSSGAIVGQGSTVTGSAARNSTAVTHDTSGAIVGQGSEVVGSGTRYRQHPSSGDLVGQGSSIAGSASRTRTHDTSGALVGQGSSLSGVAQRNAIHTSTGSLVGQGATLAGSATRTGGAITITFDQLLMVADIWQRLGLNPAAPLTETEVAAAAGTLSLAKTGALITTRTGASDPGDLTAMLLDIWQRLGLDPGNPMTATETAVSAGGVAQTIAPVTGGVLVTRT